MYITNILTKTQKGKISHRCILLRESYRENGKVKNRTIANLTHADPKDVAAMRLALKYKNKLQLLGNPSESVKLKEGLSVGAVWTVYEVARRLGVEKALGTDRAGKLALWQVMSRVIKQGSRLGAVRLAETHAAADVLGLERGFDENDLYKNLAWLSENQEKIEKGLFRARRGKNKPELFLYDVTSSYLEGGCNELANRGYNRDGKKGKRQIVIGLLCDEAGEPVATQVFGGNTQDTATFGSQIKKVASAFGCERVTFVGDRGMIKGPQIADLAAEKDFHYISAITKAQIETMLKSDIFQLSLFDRGLAEVETGFRTMKTGHLEVRPLYVRKQTSTRGHVLVVMLAYLIIRELKRAWAGYDLTVEEGIEQLGTLCSMTVSIKDGGSYLQIPEPRDQSMRLLSSALVRLPEALPHRKINVVSRRKLTSRRKIK